MSKRMKTRSFDVIKKSSSSKKITIDALDDYCLEEILSYLKPEEILYVEQCKYILINYCLNSKINF